MLSLVEPCVCGAWQVWGVSDAGAARVRGVEAGGHRAGVRAVAIAPDDRTLLSLAGNAAKVRWLHHTISNVVADMVWCVIYIFARCVIPNICAGRMHTPRVRRGMIRCGRACSQ